VSPADTAVANGVHFLLAPALFGHVGPGLVRQKPSRCRSYRRPPVLSVFGDGSYLARIARPHLRVIEAEVKATGTTITRQVERATAARRRCRRL
jgi:hypothetical protein